MSSVPVAGLGRSSVVRAGSTVPGHPVDPVLPGGLRVSAYDWFSLLFAWPEGVLGLLL
ncbi:hypothetical protein SGFS_044670 [Streptomyces graminofaciens]|uniref:Uncharacterized protein n=1 Tax=Streptomyces graminofaciens TaxID=68212 RepID=A0ABM7FAZ4_9ACTN|nr:hypothetical protein SGFS_044670 [Streptomyces graminofaciens]